MRNTQTDRSWVVVTDNGKYAYVTNAMSNNISSYRVRPDGTMTLLEPNAGRADELPRPVAIAEDMTLSENSRCLYARNARDGDIFAFEVQSDGQLKEIQSLPGRCRREADRSGRLLGSAGAQSGRRGGRPGPGLVASPSAVVG